MKKRIIAVLMAAALCVGSAPFSEKTCEVKASVIENNLENGTIVDSGVVDNNRVFWEINDNGTLHIWGEGEIPDSQDTYNEDFSPWNGSQYPYKKVIIDSGITRIGNWAFYNQQDIVTVDISDSVKRIELSAFERCSSLENVNIPGGVQFIGEKAFSGCQSLNNLIINEGTKWIQFKSFEGCTNLRSAKIPSTVEWLDDYVFYGCSNLEEVTFAGDIEHIGRYIFNECKDGIVVYGYTDSNVEKYAVENSLSFISIGRIEKDEVDTSDDSTISEEDQTIKTNISSNLQKAGFTGSVAQRTKKENTITAKGKTVRVKYSKLTKKKQSIKANKAFTVSNAQGKVTYKLASVKKAKFKKYFKVSSTGKITVKKGLKKGTYKLKIKVTAAGNANYKPLTKTVTVKVKVK